MAAHPEKKDLEEKTLPPAKKSKASMSVLVTGAAGFVGSHVCLELHKRGVFVLGLDIFSAYYAVELKRARAENVRKAGIELIEGDICDDDLLAKLFAQHHFTHVCHLAAQPGVRYSLENPQAYVTANIKGFVSILEVCRKQQPMPVLVYASSSSVYGMNEKVPFAETDKTDEPVSLYGATKKCDELFAHAYHHCFGLKVTGLRFFTVFGPWGRPDMAYYSFTRDILAGKPIEIYNEGDMKRDFTYVDDIVRGVILALETGCGCEVFNLGNHHPEPLSALIEAIETAVGKKAICQMKPMHKGDVLSTYADAAHAKEVLGFESQVRLKDGIKNFVTWYRSFYKV